MELNEDEQPEFLNHFFYPESIQHHTSNNRDYVINGYGWI